MTWDTNMDEAPRDGTWAERASYWGHLPENLRPNAPVRQPVKWPSPPETNHDLK